ncbi:MAG: hypothetical protein L6437_07805 [Kiritimatiellae bacterium]|nr:hypothetical protein [Kiritimatiellia bacterium]
MKYKKTKSSGYSAGRGTRVKHSTSMEWDEVAEKSRIYPVKYSTGEDARLKHSTGMEFDNKTKENQSPKLQDQPGGARHPGFTYKHYRKQKREDREQTTDDKKVYHKSFKKVIVDY